MVYHGTVQGGVVQFETGIAPPEDGTLVRVETIAEPLPALTEEADSLFRMEELAGDSGISDLASNLDHYLYGAGRGDMNE